MERLGARRPGTFAQKLWKSCGKVAGFLSSSSGISCRYDILHKISSAGEQAAPYASILFILNNLKARAKTRGSMP
jgi:hypothetical protein